MHAFHTTRSYNSILSYIACTYPYYTPTSYCVVVLKSKRTVYNLHRTTMFFVGVFSPSIHLFTCPECTIRGGQWLYYYCGFVTFRATSHPRVSDALPLCFRDRTARYAITCTTPGGSGVKRYIIAFGSPVIAFDR